MGDVPDGSIKLLKCGKEKAKNREGNRSFVGMHASGPD